MLECAESKECHAPKHHYDQCVERVTGQIENDGKASEDCVEECTSMLIRRLIQLPSNTTSLPPRSLRNSMRSTQALRSAQVIVHVQSKPHMSIQRSTSASPTMEDGPVSSGTR